MEPVSALAFACNVLDLVEKGIKCGKVIHKLYKDGATDDQDDLESIADTIEAVVTGLRTAPNNASVRKSAIDSQIVTLLARSTALCTTLRDLIKKCQPDAKGSWRAAGIAALKKLCHKSDIEALEKELESCRTGLAALFSAATHQSVVDMKVELEEVGMKNDRISNKIRLLDNRLREDTQDLKSQLGSLLSAFQEAYDAVKEKQILDSLAFADMDARFITVHDAEQDTFDWIFNDPGVLFDKEPRLAMSFTDWLRSGSGIFHIVGLPGSGKSTLMKYLCEKSESEVHLQEWAAADGKDLVFCKFFFWRITTVAEQKTLKGLVRGLLHGVLSQVPSLARRLFPKQWAVKRGISQPTRQAKLTDREISDAFEALMSDTAIFESFRLCFFIDGLDEFEQNINLQSDTYASLARKLQKWASNSGGNVKMCVSSRPLLEFVKIFPESQQITLQRLTENDIRTLVTNRLEGNERFAELRALSEDASRRCDELHQMILTEAQGVFLWVVLVLGELEQALANLDSLTVLEKIVATAHKEIKDLIHGILLSIPRIHRQGSYYLLAIIMRMLGVFVSKTKTMAALQVILDSGDVDFGSDASHIHLAECAMLFNAADHGNLLDCDKGLAVISLDQNDNADAIAKEKDRLLARCRGLVEVDADSNIRFTHRAIPEALRDIFSENNLENSVEDDKVIELLIWIILADVRKRGETKWRNIKMADGDSSMMRLRFVLFTEAQLHDDWQTGPKGMISLLYSIHETILSNQYGTMTPEDGVWNDWRWWWVGFEGFERQMKLGIFDRFDFPAFTGSLIDEKLSPEKDTNRLLAYLCEVVMAAAGHFPGDTPGKHEYIISRLLHRGLTLDSQHPLGYVHDGECQKSVCKLWHEFVCRELYSCMTHRMLRKYHDYRNPSHSPPINWTGLETLLRFGTDPDVYLSIGRQRDKRVLLGQGGEILYSMEEAPTDSNDDQIHYYPSLIESGQISLAEFIKHCQPPNAGQLLSLIEQNRAKKDEPPSTTPAHE